MKKIILSFIFIFNFIFADATKDLFDAINKSDISKIKVSIENNANVNFAKKFQSNILFYLLDKCNYLRFSLLFSLSISPCEQI